MEQTPIFIPQDCISSIVDVSPTPFRCGQMEIKPKGGRLKGYRCESLKAEYWWIPNGAGKGFSQVLSFNFEGRSSHFNYLMRVLQNSDDSFVVLLPRGDVYTVVGGYAKYPITMPEKGSSTDDQTFAMYCAYATAPFPFYDGFVDSITDCDVAELMDALFGKRD